MATTERPQRHSATRAIMFCLLAPSIRPREVTGNTPVIAQRAIAGRMGWQSPKMPNWRLRKVRYSWWKTIVRSAASRQRWPFNLDGRKSNREDDRFAVRLPEVHDIGSENDVVPFLPQRHHLGCPAHIERHAQGTTADQDRNRGGVPVSQRTGSLFAILVQPPFQLNVSLMP